MVRLDAVEPREWAHQVLDERSRFRCQRLMTEKLDNLQCHPANPPVLSRIAR